MRRGYVVALLVTVGFAVAYVVRPGAASQAHPISRRDRAATIAAMRLLRVPGDFVRHRSGCSWYRCYLVARPTLEVAPELAGILASVGARTKEIEALANQMAAKFEIKGYPMPNLVGCTPLPATAWRVAATRCTHMGIVNRSAVVIVFLSPYIACKRPRHCKWTPNSEVDISFGWRDTAA